MDVKAINLCIPEWCGETEALGLVGAGVRGKGTARAQVLRLEASGQYLQVLLPLQGGTVRTQPRSLKV